MQLRFRDTLLFCTDGLTDARDANDQEFELEDLLEICIRHATATPPDLLGQIFRGVPHFTRDCRQWDTRLRRCFITRRQWMAPSFLNRHAVIFPFDRPALLLDN